MQVPEIDVEELARRHADGATVIDVRQQDEYDAGHVPGARLLPLDELPERLDEVPGDGPVLLICKTGGRSLKAAEYLAARGVDAVNVAGGTKGWIAAGEDVVTGSSPE